MTLQDTIQNLTDDEFRDLKAWIVTTETDRRAAQPAIEEAQAEIMAEVWEAQPDLKPAYVGTVDPDTPTLDALLAQLPPWVQPTGKASAYPPASLVKHLGRAWRNRRRGLNSNEPGTPFSGWEDVTDDYLKLADAQDGNAPDADTTDAPGLITEPEAPKQPEVTPAPQLPEWKAGEWYSKGESVRVGSTVYTSLKLHRATEATHPTKDTSDWLKLG